MRQAIPHRGRAGRAFLRGSGVATILAATAATAVAQDAGTSSGGLAPETTPYYIGASQGFTHDSNVYNVPFGPSDNYSSTSLLAGFDQYLGRQRAFGTAKVSLNRYQDETRLNNTTYSLATGIDWATLYKLSGNVTATLDQRLVAPAAVAAPVATRNLERQQGINGTANWGGDSLITVQARGGYSTVNYSAPEYVGAESRSAFGSLGVFYRPGTRLRVGVAARFDHTRSPQALLLPDGSYEGTSTNGRNLDLLLDYNNGNSLSTSARVSYTQQSNAGVDGGDFSGLTGSLDVRYRVTGKIGVSLSASRDAGFNAARGGYTTTIVMQPTTPGGTPVATPVTSSTLYQNNQVSNRVAFGATYAATAKIGVTAGAHYVRSRTLTAADGQNGFDVVDEARGVSLGADYAWSRSLSFNCYVSRERREVSGGLSYGYNDNLASCTAQFIWR